MTDVEWQSLKSRFKPLQPGGPTLVVAAFDILIMIVSAWLRVRGGIPGAVLSVPLLALALLHLYLLQHEATHSAFCRSRRMNDLAGHFCSWLILMPFPVRQRSHLLHHMWTGHPKGDPANERIIRRFKVMTAEEARKLERVWRWWIPMITINDRRGMWKDPWRQIASGATPGRFAREIRILRLYFAGYALALIALLATGTAWGFVSWYGPAFIIQLLMEEIANLPHHAETPLLDPAAKALPYREQYRVTHSVRSVPVWSRFVLLNFNLHTAHHLFPWLPWHALREAHREIVPRIPGLETSQSTPSEIEWSLRNRRRPLLSIMGHYLDKQSKPTPAPARIPPRPAAEPSDLPELFENPPRTDWSPEARL